MKEVEIGGETLTVVELKSNGICGVCGQVGAYDFSDLYRCQVCVSSEVAELLEAAKGALARYPELSRLQAAVKDFKGRRVRDRG